MLPATERAGIILFCRNYLWEQLVGSLARKLGTTSDVSTCNACHILLLLPLFHVSFSFPYLLTYAGPLSISKILCGTAFIRLDVVNRRGG